MCPGASDADGYRLVQAADSLEGEERLAKLREAVAEYGLQIAHYESMGEMARAAVAGSGMATTMVNLAVSLDPVRQAAAIRDAIAVHLRASSVLPVDASSNDKALVWHQLGRAHTDLADLLTGTEKEAELQGAIRSFRTAATGLPKDGALALRSLVHNNLGHAIQESAAFRSGHTRVATLLEAAQAFMEAFQASAARKHEDTEGYWVNMADAVDEASHEDLEPGDAIEGEVEVWLERTLTVFPTGEAARRGIAAYHLGRMRCLRGDEIEGPDKLKAIDLAIGTVEQALELLPPSSDRLMAWHDLQCTLMDRADELSAADRTPVLVERLAACRAGLAEALGGECGSSPSLLALQYQGVASSLEDLADVATPSERAALLEEAETACRRAIEHMKSNEDWVERREALAERLERIQERRNPGQ